MPNYNGWDDDLEHDNIPIGAIAVALLMAAPIICIGRFTNNKNAVYISSVVMCIVSMATGGMQYLFLDLLAVFFAASYEVSRISKLQKSEGRLSSFYGSHSVTKEQIAQSTAIYKSIITKTEDLIKHLSNTEKARVMIWMGMISENANQDRQGAMMLNWPSLVTHSELISTIKELDSGRRSIDISLQQARAFGTHNEEEIMHMTGSLHAYYLLVSSLAGGIFPDSRNTISAIWTELFKGHEFIDSVAPGFHRMLLRAIKGEEATEAPPSIPQLCAMAYFVPEIYSQKNIHAQNLNSGKVQYNDGNPSRNPQGNASDSRLLPKIPTPTPTPKPKFYPHKYNTNGFCENCGWKKDYIERNPRDCAIHN